MTFEQVRFAYPGRAPVLRDFDLTIEPGQRVGLVGYSGAGKSTVLARCSGSTMSAGRILMDGQDIRDVTQESLRATMAIVPQDISLFHRSVLENIRYARPDAPEEDVLAAAEMANCREFIEALPEGFDTMVGDRGVKLSGGQRQRLAIARALLKDAPILLLDEATSALDSESERAIQDALDRLMQGRTVIAIAHRLATLKSFDRIIVMDRGHIVDDGPPGVLAARPGPYRDLLRKQHWRNRCRKLGSRAQTHTTGRPSNRGRNIVGIESDMSRLVVVSNRVAPITEGEPTAGGLAAGVLDALKQQGGIWFGWSGEITDDAARRRACRAHGRPDHALHGRSVPARLR